MALMYVARITTICGNKKHPMEFTAVTLWDDLVTAEQYVMEQETETVLNNDEPKYLVTHSFAATITEADVVETVKLREWLPVVLS